MPPRARDAAVTLDDVERAARTIGGLVRETPTLLADSLSETAGTPVLLKAENLQRTGSFKIRGATNAIANLAPHARDAGVVAASAGNHAQAVALAAARTDTRATLCMPAEAPLAKLDSVRRYGGEVRLVDGSYDEAQEEARALAEAEGRPLIHAFADPDVVAGQGTIGAEIVRDVPDVRSIVVPLGGGGLISGVAIAAKALVPGLRVVGVQAEACSPYPDSLAAKRPIGARSARTIADGIAVKRPMELTLALVERYVDEVVTVSDDEIARTMVHLIERSRLVVEGAGAAAAAALEHGRIEVPADGPCCVVLSGGNVDASLLAECIRMGETAAGRRTVLKTVVPDRPGALAGLLRLVAGHGANIIDVAHLREGVDLHVRETLIRLVIQTNGAEHAAAITDAMTANGFAIEVER
jgi:threonine dehydratase